MKHITEEKLKKRIAVVRCDTVSEACPGVGCFMAFNNKKSHFERYEGNVEMMGFFTCGGCSGRRIYRLVNSLKKHKVDIIHMSSCMFMENYPECPHIDSIQKTIEDAGIEVVKGTHH